MTWSPLQKLMNSQMDVEEMQGRSKQVSMTSQKVKIRFTITANEIRHKYVFFTLIKIYLG